MSWARVETAILTHPKWQLPADAFKFAIKLLLWATQHSRGSGIVPRNVLDEQAGSRRRANRLIKILSEAGRPLHEFGILVPLSDQAWRLHDFEQYAPPQDRPSSRPEARQEDRSSLFTTEPTTPVQQARTSPEQNEHRERVSARRAEAGRRSAQARKSRNGTAQPRSRNPEDEWAPEQSGVFSAEQNGGTGAEQNPKTGARVPNKPVGVTANKSEQNPFQDHQDLPVSGSGEEILKNTATTTDLTGCTRETAPVADVVVATASHKIRCPKSLELTAEQKERLAGPTGVPDWAVPVLLQRFLVKAVGHDPRTLQAWGNSAAGAIHAMWHDPKQRPSRPESFKKDEDRPGVKKTLTYGRRADGTMGYS